MWFFVIQIIILFSYDTVLSLIGAEKPTRDSIHCFESFLGYHPSPLGSALQFFTEHKHISLLALKSECLVWTRRTWHIYNLKTTFQYIYILYLQWHIVTASQISKNIGFEIQFHYQHYRGNNKAWWKSAETSFLNKMESLMGKSPSLWIDCKLGFFCYNN